MLVVAPRPAPFPLLWQPPPRTERAVYQSWLKAQRLWQPLPPRQQLADKVADAIATAEEASRRVEQEQLALQLQQTRAALQSAAAELAAEKEAAARADADAEAVHIEFRLRVGELEAEVERLKVKAAAKKAAWQDSRSHGHRAFFAARAETFFNGGELPPVPLKQPLALSPSELALMRANDERRRERAAEAARRAAAQAHDPNAH